MTQYSDLVEARRKEISEEEWNKQTYCIHAQHGTIEVWYNDGSKKITNSKTNEVTFVPPSES